MPPAQDAGMQLFGNVLDLLFPPACISCNAERTWLCGTCRGRQSPSRQVRQGIRVLCAQEPASAPAVRALYAAKYEGMRGALEALAGLLAGAVAVQVGTNAGLTLVPVITDRARQRERGFDQARVLAIALGELLGIPVADLLLRSRANRPQVGLDRDARMQNMHGLFVVRGAVPTGRLILVDDVCTSGATFAAAAAALRDAGAVAIEGAVLFGRIDSG